MARTCELCITDWSARIRDISFELADVNTGATWQTTTPPLHVGRWNDIWEVRLDPFHLSKALAHVTLVVDMDRLNDEGGRPSLPSASSRPSKPAPAPPRWSSVSTAPTSKMTTGTRSSPDAFRSSRARGMRAVVACPDGPRGPRKSSSNIDHPNAPTRPLAAGFSHTFPAMTSLAWARSRMAEPRPRR